MKAQMICKDSIEDVWDMKGRQVRVRAPVPVELLRLMEAVEQMTATNFFLFS